MSQSMSSVSRKKYDQVKRKLEKLAEYCEDLQQENQDLLENLKEVSEKFLDLKKQFNEENNSDKIDGLVEENRILQKTIRKLEKEVDNADLNIQRGSFELRQDLMLKEGKVAQLKEALELSKQRYNDLYEEYKEFRRQDRRS